MRSVANSGAGGPYGPVDWRI